jgi:hypothetical protein
MVVDHACFVCAGFPLIIKKLKDLVPVLVNCFQDFIPSAHTMPLLDAQSFDCLLCILQSIDIAFRFFIYGTDKGKSEYRLPQGQSDVTVWDESIPSLLMKKILLVFPLNPMWQLSEKVWSLYKFSDHYLCSYMTMLDSFFSFNSIVLIGLPFFCICFCDKICHISFDPIYLFFVFMVGTMLFLYFELV